MKGIYYIKNLINKKIYVGKSININRRLTYHRYSLNKSIRLKDVNRFLYNSVQKYGWDNFETGILEECDNLEISELKWMDIFESYNSNYGYNLRRDTSTKCIVHEETKKLMSKNNKGKNNPNYNNKWTKEAKKNMSKIMKKRHASGKYYTEEWKNKISKRNRNIWKDEDKKLAMAKKVSKSKQKYFYLQYDRKMNLIKVWNSVKDIIKSNPDYKWQNIYSVCNGYKPTYKNYIWKKKLMI